MQSYKTSPIMNAILDHYKKGAIPFHMPGHKQGQGIWGPFFKSYKDNPFIFDMTEVPGLDDLHAPSGPIQEAQEKAAEIFGADVTYFLVNGTTVGIHAAIMAVCGQGEEILLPRDIHRSVIGACIISGAKPTYLKSSINQNYLIACPPDPDEVRTKIALNPHLKALFTTYPSYYGLVGRLSEIADVAHAKNVPLLVDEAHGSHFTFSQKLPKTALECGADLTIQSTHKTLGAFTQSSMLHLNENRLDRKKVASALKLLQSTSPSYILMSSLEAATEHMNESGASVLDTVLEISEWSRMEINKIPGYICMGEDILSEKTVVGFDPTKLYISVMETGLTGYQIEKLLWVEHGIQVELSDQNCVLCMITVGTRMSDVQALVKALENISQRHRLSQKLNKLQEVRVSSLPAPKVVITPREAWFGGRRKVKLREALGAISAEIVAPYPPGIPVLCPGEEITMEVLECIQYFKSCGHHFQGPSDAELDYVEVVD